VETTGQRLLEAETRRDLAVQSQLTARGPEAVGWLQRAERQFEQLDARLDLQQLAALKGQLAAT